MSDNRGLVTASVVGKLLTPTLKVADNDTSRALTATLAAERITGWTEESHMTPDMWRGVDQSPSPATSTAPTTTGRRGRVHAPRRGRLDARVLP
jgi:hypothetical protein